MRLLHVTDTFLPKIGGAEIAIDQLTRAMREQQVDAEVLAQANRGFDNTLHLPYPVRRFAHPRTSLLAGWWTRRHIAKLHNQKPFDVIVGHHSFPPGYAVVKFALANKLKSIVYPRGGDIYRTSRWRKRKRTWSNVEFALKNASAVLYASDAMRELILEIVGANSTQRLIKIPNGVNLVEVRADASSSKYASDVRLQKPFVLGLGRTTRLKGFDLLIDAFKQINPASHRLVLAGDGKELENLRTQAGPLGDKFLSTGMVSGADKRWLLQNCAFLVAPSREESFGNVALEAMACGKPVLASNASGFVEMVQPGINGNLFKVDDLPSLTDQLRDYLAKDLNVESQGASKTAEQFAWPIIARRWIELIDSL